MRRGSRNKVRTSEAVLGKGDSVMTIKIILALLVRATLFAIYHTATPIPFQESSANPGQCDLATPNTQCNGFTPFIL